MQDGLEDVDIMYVGCLPVELDPDEQDVCAFQIFMQLVHGIVSEGLFIVAKEVRCGRVSPSN